MAGDWRISADERMRYEAYFHQCKPTQDHLTGEQARHFFVKSGLPGDVLRKIWDLADVTVDGRLDKREFAVACHLIASQVQKKGPLPATLPPSLLSDAGPTANGGPSANSAPTHPTVTTQQHSGDAGKAAVQANTPLASLTPAIRSKYLQQFHALVDATKSDGFIIGLQAKTILQQTGLSHVLLHQIWNLADYDRDGRLSADEFTIAMHFCDLARMGQPLPPQLPEEWLQTNAMQHERTDTQPKPVANQTYAHLNQQLQETINATHQAEATPTTPPVEPTEAERKQIAATYEEKRLRNYEDGNRELERRRQLLREQEEREQKEREERERKRELELQKHRDEQERKKQMEIERQLEKQRQIEQQKEEERKKLYEQREAARKELERKNRLEWERQRMQELSTQKSRLQEQINDLKSRETAFGMELESMDDTMQTSQTKISQIEVNIHSTDESIAEVQRNIATERSDFESVEQQRKDLMAQLNSAQAERESLDSSVNQLIQSKEFSAGNREADQIQYLQGQIESMTQESAQIDEQVVITEEQCKEYQSQMEQFRLEFEQLEQEAKNKKPPSPVVTPVEPPAEFADFNQFNADVPSDDINNQASDVSPTMPVVSTTTSSPPHPPSPPAIDVDPFQTVDPFASHSDAGTTPGNADWFQPTHNDNASTTVDPFLPKPEPTEPAPVVASPKVKKAAPKANPGLKDAPKQSSTVDPWGAPTTASSSADAWPPFDSAGKTSSPFGTSSEWPQTTTTANENSPTGTIQYRVLYDYAPERSDEMAISSGDIITVDPTKQQDDQWLFGRIGNDKQGFFPVAYAEQVISTPAATAIDTTSPLASGSWVLTLAECEGKTADKHLSFSKDELILVREQKDAIWYSGELRGKVGWFPRNYVRPATEVESANKPSTPKNSPANEMSSDASVSQTSAPANHVETATSDVYEAIYAFEPTDPSDLSFDVGDRITVLKRDGDWWTGQIGERTGTFPNNYVQKVGHAEEIAVAIAPFESTEEGHLTFEKDQTIYVTKKDDSGWYQGEIRLPDQTVRAGLFPADRVQLQTAASTASAAVSHHQSTSGTQHYMAIFPYEAQQDDELSFPADAVLEILDPENTSGWFKARLGDQAGLIPSTYVQPVDSHNHSSSTPCYLSPRIIPRTSTTANTSQQPLCDDTTITSVTDSSTSYDQVFHSSARISAIRELIDTEQRYVNDLRTVANEFIKPLSNGRILNDCEVEQLFSNWFSLIACNSVFLSTLQDQVQYKESVLTFDDDVYIRTPRSASMSNIARIAQAPTKLFVDTQHLSFIRPDSPSSPLHRIRGDAELDRLPLAENLSVKRSLTIERLDDNIVPQSSRFASHMTINEATRIGEILCSYLPYMADAYFQYCNCRSQANKHLQAKIALSKQFRSYLKIFQNQTGGLSLNGFLTKPIQRVTRYPLLIEKILKHTDLNHPDRQFIQQAYECARQLNERINKQIREQEDSLRLDWLQQHFSFSTDEDPADSFILDELVKFNSRTKFHAKRQLLLHGFITKMPSGKELLVFLFNDFLLFSTAKAPTTNWQSQLFERKANLQLKLYRMPIFLTDIMNASESATDQLTFSIVTKSSAKPLVLRTPQTNIRTLWVRAITNAVDELRALEPFTSTGRRLLAITEEDHDYGSTSAVARLILVVQEAHDLMPSVPTLERLRTVNPYCEIVIGASTSRTPYVKRTANPKWSIPMQFLLHDLIEDLIHISIYDHKYFGPDDNIGSTVMCLQDIIPCALDAFVKQPPNAFTRTIYLNNGASLVLKCLVQFRMPCQ